MARENKTERCERLSAYCTGTASANAKCAAFLRVRGDFASAVLMEDGYFRQRGSARWWLAKVYGARLAEVCVPGVVA